MTGKTHERIGFLAPLCIGSIYCLKTGTNVNFLNALLLLSFSVFGSTIPDIDQTQSKSGRKLPITSHLIKGTNKIAKIFKNKNLQRATGHRGLTHSFLLWFLIYLVFYVLFYRLSFITPIQYAVNGFFIGVATHLFLDMLNPSGIPFLAPLSFFDFHILNIRTNSKEEKTFNTIFTLLCLCITCFCVSKLIRTNQIVFDISNITQKCSMFLRELIEKIII